jgi:spore maturation protein SpmB
MTYRSQYGAENPADIFIPILIATFFASLIGLITVAIYQKINLLDKVILAYLGSITAVIIGMIWYFSTLSEAEVATQSALLSNIILFGIICGFIIMGLFKKVNIYESFIEGAKDGFGIAIKIIPYLIAILVSIGVFRASGAMDYLLDGFEWFFSLFFSDVRFVEGLPTALMKPLSGSGARGMMIDTFNTHGVDSFIGHLTATLQGATDTTFYIIAVYFGSVGIRKTRYAVKAGLLADLAGIVAGIIIATVFFGSSDSKALSPKETVETFTQHWVNLEPTRSIELMHENCVLIDQTYDTAYANPRAITYDFLGADSLAQEKMDIQALNATGDNKSAEVHLKIKRASKLEKEAFTFTIEKGKIRTIKYLGNF